MSKKYPEIEKIFIDFDIYIHRMELKEELKDLNPLTNKYYEGYKQCYKDIRNRIRELIERKKED